MKKIIVCLLIGMASVSSAEQIFQAKTGQTITATISSKDLTRVQVSGFPILKAYTASNVKVKKDTATGQLYILPYDIKGSFNLFIADTNGDTFNLALTPSRHKGGDSIVIMPDKESLSRNLYKDKAVKGSSTYERTIMNLVQIMYLNMKEEDGIGYQVTEAQSEIPIWKKVKVVLVRNYNNQALNGYIYEVTNNGSDPILLTESEFYKSGILAVAIDSPSLAPGQTTRVFLVQENTGI